MHVQQHILFVDPNKQQNQVAQNALINLGLRLDFAADFATAQKCLQVEKYDLVFCHVSMPEVMKWIRDQNLSIPVVALAPSGIQEALQDLQKMPFVNFLICQDLSSNSFAIKNIQATVSKILKQDYFGIAKYVSPGAAIQKINVQRSTERANCIAQMQNALKKLGVRASILDRCWIVAEEMLMNAIYDAPTNTDGKSLFNHLPRTQEVVLAPDQEALLQYACDGDFLAIAVTDPFGCLQKNTIFDYLMSCYQGHAGSLNKEKGGAGRGLHQIIENSDLTVFNVQNKLRTEVICLIRMEATKGAVHSPLFHYCIN